MPILIEKEFNKLKNYISKYGIDIVKCKFQSTFPWKSDLVIPSKNSRGKIFLYLKVKDSISDRILLTGNILGQYLNYLENREHLKYVNIFNLVNYNNFIDVDEYKKFYKINLLANKKRDNVFKLLKINIDKRFYKIENIISQYIYDYVINNNKYISQYELSEFLKEIKEK